MITQNIPICASSTDSPLLAFACTPTTNLNKLNDVFCDGGFSILLGKIFEPLLVIWVQELQIISSEQMERLFEIQVKEKEDNDMIGIPF